MFKRRRRVTVIAEGLNIKGNVTAEGLVEVHGEIEGELNCTTLRVSKKGRINGKIVCQDVVVDGMVEGPIHGTHVRLEAKAHVIGDVHHESFAIEKGALFDGRSRQKDLPAKEKSTKASAKKDTMIPLQNGSGSKASAEATAA